MRLRIVEVEPVQPQIAEPRPAPTEPFRLKISGHAAELYIWSAEEWARLANPPRDAMCRSDGTRAALRMA